MVRKRRGQLDPHEPGVSKSRNIQRGSLSNYGVEKRLDSSRLVKVKN